MLVLSRHRDESIMIGDDVVVTVVDLRGDKVRIGIAAPIEVAVHRQEIYESIQRENRADRPAFRGRLQEVVAERDELRREVARLRAELSSYLFGKGGAA